MYKNQIINATPHAIKLNCGLVFEPSGLVIRVDEDIVLEDCVTLALEPGPDAEYESKHCILLYDTQVTNLDLPPFVSGTVYIVSSRVLDAIRALGLKRYDFWAPATGHEDVIRNSKGQIDSVPGFVRIY